ncbi:MerR family transcriptional regulator [Gordonia alkaliphila]|uniref:MerR family transcriptional regulator n=1 Tax=Gordonia alkaliphila TaxID=1053547 RepID=A0ABP8ZFB1_9ACTN|nr:MerR family transcriptional regulator [Gordonia alkaliphila]MCK0439325.1 MerR family transcriptional regulator [Gordonia alkaliphila]
MTEYRIDDLARAAGTTVRNVRGYQDRGLIPRPVRRGRVAIYTDQHLDRLRVINDLLGRGFTMAHIAEFVAGVERGDDLVEVLGLEGLITEPIERTPTAQVPAAELSEQLGDPEPEVLQELRAFGLISPIDDDPVTEYLVHDTETLDAYRSMMAIGIELPYILGLQRQLEDDLAVAARTLITAGRGAITEGRFDGWIPESDEESDWAASFIQQLRHTGRVTAHNSLNRALDRELTRQLDDYLSIARSRRR